MRLILYTGKGGVGKTTTAAATAVGAALRGRRTLVASSDAAHSLGDVLECPLGAEPSRIAPNLDAVEIDARAEMVRHWGATRDFLVAIFHHQGIEEVVAEELAMLPGAEEVATLLAVEELAESGAYDLLVVDCAPTDATLRLLTLPDVAHRSLRVLLPLMQTLAGVATPLARRLVSVPLPAASVFREADRLVHERLAAIQRRIAAPDTTVRLVVTPERMVIDEARRAYTELCLFDVASDAVVMNRLLPAEAAAETFFRDFSQLQERRCREVAEAFAPLPVLSAPLARDEVTGLDRLGAHAALVFGELPPEARLGETERIRFESRGGDYLARVPLPGADPARLDVAVVDGALTITTGARRRSLTLPRRMAALPVARARLEGASLVVHFARKPAALGAL